jgi:hypothetical protein
MQGVRRNMQKKLMEEIERVVWMDASNEEIVNSIRGLLYQYGACMDNLTEQMFGDDDAHIRSPNARRI